MSEGSRKGKAQLVKVELGYEDALQAFLKTPAPRKKKKAKKKKRAK
jgi:hypothetical protein